MLCNASRRSRRLIVPLLLLCVSATRGADSPVKLADLTTEHAINPIGIGVTTPRFSWKLQADGPAAQNQKQTAYEIEAYRTPIGDIKGLPAPLWRSGKIVSDQSVLVPWGGPKLAARDSVQWSVRIWDKDDQPTAWSNAGGTPATFELGILNPAADWKGQWISSNLPRYDIDQTPLAKAHWISGGATAQQATGIRTTLTLPENAKVLTATLDANADGLLNLTVNGQITRQGASSHTAPFHADFVNQLKPGKNTLAIFSLAVRRPTQQDTRNAIAGHIAIDLADGTHIDLNTDDQWKAASNPAGTPQNPVNWADPAFDDSAWPAAKILGPYDPKTVAASADSTIGPGRYLRKTFTPKGPIAKARLYSTALGTYEASINGKPINDHLLDPGWTEYTKRVMVQTTDVTNLLKPGQNALGIALADGWFAGRVGWAGLAQYAQISRRPLFNAQLEITYTDGTTDIIASDASWKALPGKITGSDQQLGEVIDNRRAMVYDYPEFIDDSFPAAEVVPGIQVPLVAQLGPPVRKLMELPPQKITRFGDTWLVDFGQNMVGHIRLDAHGPAGTTVRVQHGEMLNPATGLIYNENLRQAISLDTFITSGAGGPEPFEPQFTFHGFRYAQITGFPGELTPDKIHAVVIGSDNPITGSFECSDPDINRLYQNIVWGQRSNFISVPTDCPQRDERMGWMGDAQVFSPTAALNCDVSGFFAKWIVDVNDGQTPAGAFNNVNPKARENQSYAVWGDAGVVIPWVMYTTYGDKSFLENNYDHMAKWVDYTKQQFPALLVSGGVGDHLAPTAPRGGGGAGAARGRGLGGPGAVTTTNLVDTAYFAHSAWIVSHAAALLGKTDDAQKYNQLFNDIAGAFNKAYVQPDGTMTAGTQTTYILALRFGLLSKEMAAAAARHLADDITTRAHLSTGFVGVGYINPTLTSIGRSDLAWQLLFTDTYPSWLFTVKQGATTMWERWDGYTPDKGFQDSSMNSFNHYSFGAVGYWLYTGAAGIQPDDSSPQTVGFKHFILNPQLTNKLTYVKGSINSPYGPISSHWLMEGDQLIYDATVPPNTTATLLLPNQPPRNLHPGTYHYELPKPVLP